MSQASSRNKIHRLTMMALLTALLCVSAYIIIPIQPVPIVLITFVACLVGFLLTPAEAFLVMVVYVLLGVIGLPVFSGGRAGLGVILGPSGGYILSWPIAYTLLSWLKGKTPGFWSYTWRAVIITIPLVYVMGVAGLMIVANMPLDKAIMVGVLPFIPGDIIKAAAAAWLAITLRRSLPQYK